MNRITVLLADDHTIVRQGLRALLDQEADFEVVAEAENGRQAVELAREHRPAVVVMDLTMPLLNGLEATRQILRILPTTRVLVLSAHTEDAYVEKVIEYGAAGYLLKETAAQALSRAIREIQAGGTCFITPLTRRLSQHRRKALARGGLEEAGHRPRLTPREREVLQLIAEGKANKETAAVLGISIKTVEKHRQSLMEKLDIHDTASLTRYAMAEGIIEGGLPPSGL